MSGRTHIRARTRPITVSGRVSTSLVNDTTSSSFLTEQKIGYTGVGSIEDCYAGIKSGTFEAVVFDAPVLAYHISQGGSDAALVGTVFQTEDYGIAFRNGSELRKQTDEALLKLREDGDYEMIKQKWFGPDA